MCIMAIPCKHVYDWMFILDEVAVVVILQYVRIYSISQGVSKAMD